jgi:serine/threonine protein kinase
MQPRPGPLDQRSVLRFKREFRSLADIHHPNLVKLYDLHRGQEAWFITMEYVVGKDFQQKFGAHATLSREASATQAFSDYGISHPEANMRAFAPELTR